MNELSLGEHNSLKYEALFSSEKNIITVIDKDWKIIEVNNPFPGMKESDVVGQYLMDLQLDAQKREEEAIIVQQAFDEQKEFSYQSKVTLNGRSIFYQASISPIIKDGEAVGAILVSRDITDEKEVESKLAESEKMYREVVENSDSIILRIDKKANIIFANQYALKFFQYSREELIGKNIVGTIVPDVDSNGKDLRLMVEEAIADPINFGQKENENIKKDGSSVWVRWGNYPQFNERGDFEEMLAIGSDITESKQREKELLYQNQLIEQAQQCIVSTDLDGTIKYLNQSAVEFYGYRKEELIDQHISILYPTHLHRSLQEDIIKPLMINGSNTVETSNIKKEGESVPVELHLALLKDETGSPIGMTGYSIDIGQRDAAQKQINLLATIVEKAQSIVGIANMDGALVYVNDYSKKLLDIPGDFTNSTFLEYIEETEQLRVQEEVLPYVLQHGRWSGESKFRNSRTNEVIRVLFDIFIIYDLESNEPLNLVTVSHDIEKIKKQQEQLIFNENRLKEAQRIGRVGSWEYDLEKDQLQWSEEVFSIYEVDPLNFNHTFQDFFLLVHPDDRALVSRKYQDHLQQKEDYDLIHRIITPNNHAKYIHVRANTLYDKEGKPIRSVGTAYDVTAQKITQLKIEQYRNELEDLVKERTKELSTSIEQLNESEKKYRTLVDSTAMGIGISIGSEVSFANPALLKMFGYNTLQEFKARSIFEHASSGGKRKLEERYAKLRKGEEVPDVIEIEYLRKDGTTFHCQISVTDIIFEGNHARHASFVDITDLKEKEALLSDSEEAYRALSVMLTEKISEKERQEQALVVANEKANLAMNAKNEFLSVMSHEIRTPLNGIIGLSGVLLHRIKNEEHLKIIKTLNQSADHLGSLVTDILDYSSIQAKKVQIINTPINIKLLSEETVDLFRELANDKGLIIKLNFDSEIPEYVLTDKTRIKQILNNLIHNAIKFTTEGSVQITLNAFESTTDHMKIEMLVSDTGVGIKPEDLANIFEAFKQVTVPNMDRVGSGLGLSIVKNLVHLMEGEVTVESTLNQGTTFSVIMPFEIMRPEEVPKEEGKFDEETVVFEGKRVLYVEDVYTNQLLMQNILQDMNIDCEIAASEEETFSKLNAMEFDLIIMDIQLAGKDGFEITADIRAQASNYQDIPIVGFTANTDKGLMVRMRKAGMNDLLTKPIVMEELMNCLKVYLVNDSFSFAFFEQTFSSGSNNMDVFYDALMSDLSTFLEHFEDHSKMGNYKLVKKEVHKLQSVAGQLKATKLSNLLEELYEADDFPADFSDKSQLMLQMVNKIRATIKQKL